MSYLQIAFSQFISIIRKYYKFISKCRKLSVFANVVVGLDEIAKYSLKIFLEIFYKNYLNQRKPLLRSKKLNNF